MCNSRELRTGNEIYDPAPTGECGKKIYSKRGAQELLNSIAATRGRRFKTGHLVYKRNRRARTFSGEKRYYHCQVCNGWHLTSQDLITLE